MPAAFCRHAATPHTATCYAMLLPAGMHACSVFLLLPPVTEERRAPKAPRAMRSHSYIKEASWDRVGKVTRRLLLYIGTERGRLAAMLYAA